MPKKSFVYQEIIANRQLPFRLLIHNQGEEHLVLRHWHRSYEISYVIAGQNENYYLDGMNFNQQTHEIVVINPYQVHGLALPAAPNRIAMTLMLPVEFVQSAGFLPEQIRFQNLIKPGDKNYDELQPLFEALYKLAGHPEQIGTMAQQIGWAYLLLGKLATDFTAQPQAALPTITKELEYIQPALDWLESSYDQEITVEKLAEIAHISSSYFAHLFKVYLQQTPMNYLENIRVIRAKQLLLNTDLSIGIISDSVGFANTKSFTTAFKRIYQLTPLKYRLSQK